MQDYIKLLRNIGHKRFYNKSEILFFEGEKPKMVLILLSGSIRLYKTSDTNKETPIHKIEHTSFIAEMPSFLNMPYPASAVCERDSEILEINIETLKNQCIKDSDFCFSLIASLCQKIKILENLINNNQKTLKEKIIEFLENNKENLQTLTQREIAKRLNISPESLSRTLKQLKDSNKLKIAKGKISL